MAGKRQRGIELTVENSSDDEKRGSASTEIVGDGNISHSQSCSVISISSDEDESEIEILSVHVGGGGGNSGSGAGDVVKDDGMTLQKQVKSQVGGYGISENRARFFTSTNDVICSVCGLMGHFAHDCTEKVECIRCFLCGRAGHRAEVCPQEYCYRCSENGHHARNCPNEKQFLSRKAQRDRKRERERDDERQGISFGQERGAEERMVYDVRPIAELCYVCGSREHADCSLLKNPRAVLSCYNCGMQGHAGNICPEPAFERWRHAVRDMEKLDRWKNQPRKPGRREFVSSARRAKLDANKNQFRQELVQRVRGDYPMEQRNSKRLRTATGYVSRSPPNGSMRKPLSEENRSRL